MASTLPVVVTLDLKGPPIEGQPDVELPLALSLYYSHSASFRLSETGTGTKTVDLGSLGTNAGPGAKLVVVAISPDTSQAAQPVLIGFESTAPSLEVSPGGFVCVASPKPTTAGVLTLKLAWAASFTGYVWVMG